DDVSANLQVLTGMLKERGYKVRPVPSGKLALQAAQHDPPDLILLDINMPEMNGYEVCQHLKANEALRGIPVIFISALTEQLDKVKAFALGGVDYLTKPFQMEELHARVETHLKLRRLQVELEAANARLAAANGTLKDALAYAEGVLDTVREPLLVLGGDLRVQTANRSFYQTFRASAAETEDQLIYHLGEHQWDIPLLRKLLEEILPRHTSFEGFEVEHEFRVVGRKVMLLNARRFSLESYQTDRILLAIEDVTERRRAEEGLRHAYDNAETQVLERTAELRTANKELQKEIEERERAEEELRLRDRAFESVVQGVIITDPSQPDNPIVYSNPAFEKITGYTQVEIKGRNCRFLQGPGTDPATVDKVRAAIRENRPCFVELLNYRKDGTPFWNALSVAPVFSNDGKLCHFVGLQTDVTSLKSLEQQLRQAQKMEAFGQLAGGVAHDFNNLLTVILGYSDLILDSLPPDDLSRGSIQEIHDAGERAALLTRQLLAFSRKQVVEPQILDLNSVVAGTERMLGRLIGEDITLTTVLAAGLDQVKADPGQIEQAIMNLVVNARDAMPRGGRITIETANVDLDEGYGKSHAEVESGRYVLLAVSDNGCGMTEEVKARIFEPFFTTKAVGRGTGLGLATVFGIVKQSDGHVRAYSEVGHGTTFKVYLPSIVEMVSAAQAKAGTPPSPSGVETILLVEDEKAVRALTGLALQKKGYTLLEAASGEEAISLCEEHLGPIHLLVSDVVMPDMGGRQLAERLTVLRPEMRVLFVSGYTDDAVVRHGVLQAEVAFLQKPFTMDALHRKVRAVLDGPG
ncbi:MAG: response regulator, partial [Acidobacteriota bacterium]|nr:response regulator [Acidobacteriota bacterium]